MLCLQITPATELSSPLQPPGGCPALARHGPGAVWMRVAHRAGRCGLEPQTGAVAESPETRQQNAEEAHRAREGSAGAQRGNPGDSRVDLGA